jgi:exodeoxyribonuclease VII large subunit
MEEYTVSRLSALIKRSIEQSFSGICLKGEISGLKIHTSGHAYFSLKEGDAMIAAICWKWHLQKQKVKLEEGAEIKCFGSATTYPARSTYQFSVERFELGGIGELLKLLEERKKKLAEEGLFDQSKKKPIPTLPKLIGVITSPTGAVIQDMLHRIRERFPRNILLWPVLVQGTGAAEQIVEAVNGMNSLPADQRPNVLIVARGGGSLEDLMAFNEEIVVRAVARSKIPIISAVGHETDTTLIDYAADLRAPTPTAAAEFAVPERIKLKAEVGGAFSRLNAIISSNLESKRLFLRSNKILNIRGIISEKIQRTDFAFDRTTSGIKNCVSRKKISLAKVAPRKPVLKENANEIWQKLRFAFFQDFESAKNSFLMASGAIESNSYAKILKKGFAFVESDKSAPIASVKEAEKHSTFNLVFSDGKMKVKPAPSQTDLF